MEPIQRLQDALGPYVKSREQVNYIRRILAVHMGQYTTTEQPSLISLATEWNGQTDTDPKLEGINGDYLEALKANTIARRNYAETVQACKTQSSSSTPPVSAEPKSTILDQKLTTLKLEQKRANLISIQQALELIEEKPAAGPEFLETDTLFQGLSSIPSPPPKAGVGASITKQPHSPTDLNNYISRLERVVLRAKLQLKQEEQLLGEARSKAKRVSKPVNTGVKLAALTTTRDGLIAWIEAELSNASLEDADGKQDHEQVDVSAKAISDQFEAIQTKYTNYMASRKALIALLSSRIAAKPMDLQQDSMDSYEPRQGTITREASSPGYPLLPYIQELQSLSTSQKNLLTVNAHLATTLSRKTKETRDQLVKQAQNSDIVSEVSIKQNRRSSNLRNDFDKQSSGHADISDRVRPWVHAADGAKIAHLELVAETMEIGQVALENSMQALQKLQQLTGQGGRQNVENISSIDTTGIEDDTLVGTGFSTDLQAVTPSRDMLPKSYKRNDMWSKIHGDLGLLGYDGP